jgi:1,2-diacylglycerol 3-beta-galactosyltransferase
MADKKRILILTADAGFGHRSAAKALAAALEDSHGDECSYEIVNALDHGKTPSWLRDVQADYDRIARKAAELYKFSYDLSDTLIASRFIDSAMRVLLYRTMRDIVLRFEPDAIVSTYPLYQAPLDALFTLRRSFVPTVCVITDLVTVHQVWFTGEPDLFIVPTGTVRSIALGAGVPAERVEVVGIPVHPKIASEVRGKAELRSLLGWRQDLTTALAVGSKRVGGLGPALDALNHSALPLQLAVVAGGDDELYDSMRGREWHLPTRLYNFVDNMPELLRASDYVIAKPGGLIVTESLAAGLPMVFVDMIAGQETGNADFVVGGGAGEVAAGGLGALEISYHLLADGSALLAQRALAAKALGRPRAAFDIMDRVWDFASRGPGRSEDRAATAIAKLKELFIRFNESFDD